MSFEMIHSGEYADAINVAKKFVGTTMMRPVLGFVHHTPEGEIIATDSKRALIIKDVHGFKEDILINPHTLEAAKGGYPNVKHIAIDDPEKVKAKLTLNFDDIRTWLQIHKSMNQMNRMLGRRNSQLTLQMTEKKLNFELTKDIQFQIRATETEVKEKLVVSYNCEFIRDALEAHAKLKSKQVEIKFYSALSPFTIEDERTLALILPLRMN